MSISIGIDTGGTYTDAVAYDTGEGRLLASAKSLTTREDLSIGICGALDRLPRPYLEAAERIHLSTTLATNACVENREGKGRLIFIGVDRDIVTDVGPGYGLPPVQDIFFVDCNRTMGDAEDEQPDWERFRAEVGPWLEGVDAAGVVGLYAYKNGAYVEKKAKAIVSELSGLPVIAGHELFSDLNAVKRGASTLLNACLIPVIARFLQGIEKALSMRDISAPIVIVRSDGSLMSEAFTSERPVETLLCGPAASVMGGMSLSGEPQSLIVDMGGTTTDVSIVRESTPLKADKGVNVGRWRTFVRGVFIDTFGLGGDSRITFGDGAVVLSANRVVPLCVLAEQYPQVETGLRRLLSGHRHGHTLPLHEHLFLPRPVPDTAWETGEEQALGALLADGPRSYADCAAALDTSPYYLERHLKRGEKRGLIMRSGLTPTDLMHVRGDFNQFSAEAAELGAAFVAASSGIPRERMPEEGYDLVKRSLYRNLVRILLEHRHPEWAGNPIAPQLETLIDDSWNSFLRGDGDLLLPRFGTPAALVGIGAPIHIFLPDVAEALGTRCVIPDNAGVANAVGAVVGNVTASCTIQVAISQNSSIVVYGKTGNLYATSRVEGVALALAEAEAEARAEAARRGAGACTVTTQVEEHTSRARTGDEIFLGISVTATARGTLLG